MARHRFEMPALLGALALLAAMPAVAQPVTSEAPERVAVTIYRAPHRGPDQGMNADWLEGYALVSEKRTVTIPAGRATIRFEGVAAGILPESAIITGLPDGVREKNLDADLLSSRSLFGRGFGRPVTIRRTVGDRVTEERAIIRSGPDGAAIVQTEAGFEALDCEVGRDRLVYDSVPAGLSARPTLSVETDSTEARQVTVTLSYLAWGFDWQANYVATMREGGAAADLVAWVTLASSDATSFPDADTLVVAGKIERSDQRPWQPPFSSDQRLEFQCMASPIPEDIYAEDIGAMPAAMAPPPPPPPPPPVMVVAESLQRIPGVALEELGDLKAYRVPDPTTVAAMAQKQVALLDKAAVPVAIVYLSDVWAAGVVPPRITLRAANTKAGGLGLPLPAGPVMVFEPHRGTPLLVGRGKLDDKAVGEDLEIGIGNATQVTAEVSKPRSGKNWTDHVLTVRNANPFPVRYEGDFYLEDGARLQQLSEKLGRAKGRPLWRVEIPANGTRTLSYRIRTPK